MGESPIFYQLDEQSRQNKPDENLQWNAGKGDNLLREAITEAELKTGNPSQNEGWKCYGGYMNQDHRKKIALVLSTLIIVFSQNTEAGKNDRPNITKPQGSIDVLVKKLSEKYDFDFKNEGQQISPEKLDSYKLLGLNFFKINQELYAKRNYGSYAFKVRFDVQGHIYIKNKYYNLVISSKPNGKIYYTEYDKNSKKIKFGTREGLI